MGSWLLVSEETIPSLVSARTLPDSMRWVRACASATTKTSAAAAARARVVKTGECSATVAALSSPSDEGAPHAPRRTENIFPCKQDREEGGVRRTSRKHPICNLRVQRGFAMSLFLSFSLSFGGGALALSTTALLTIRQKRRCLSLSLSL